MSAPDPATSPPSGSEPLPRTRRRARHIPDHCHIGPARRFEVLKIRGCSD